jgi:uncharacterized membrane protein (UPF0127 family)
MGHARPPSNLDEGHAFFPHLIWLEPDGRVAGMLTNVPACASPTCPLYEPNGTHESVAVLELQAGGAANHGINVGAVIRGLPRSVDAR